MSFGLKPGTRTSPKNTMTSSNSKGSDKAGDRQRLFSRSGDACPRHGQAGQTQLNSANRESSRASCSACEEGNDGISHSTDVDEGNNDDKPGDVHAPSDCTIIGYGHQAGQPTTELVLRDTKPGDKRRRSSETLDDEQTLDRKARVPKRLLQSNTVVDDSSDDEIYQEVDWINGWEEEGSVELHEEQLIIESEEEACHFPTARPHALFEEQEEFDLDDSRLFSDGSFFDEQFDCSTRPDLGAEMGIFGPTDDLNDLMRVGIERQVSFSEPAGRFNTPNQQAVNSDGNSSTSPHTPEAGPTVVQAQRNGKGAPEALKPSKHKATIFKSNDGSKEIQTLEGDGDVQDSCGSGYESDFGETTEDELPPVQLQSPTRCTLRSSFSTENSQAPEVMPNRYPRGLGPGPRMGFWIADPSKSIGLIDCTGKRLVVYPAQQATIAKKKSYRVINSRINQNWHPRGSKFFGQPSGLSSSTHVSSVANPHSENTHGSNDDPNREFVAPIAQMWTMDPNEVYSAILVNRAGTIAGATFEEDSEPLIDLGAFIHWGDSSEESEAEKEDMSSLTSETSSPILAIPQLPQSTSSAGQSNQALPDHLGRGIVSTPCD